MSCKRINMVLQWLPCRGSAGGTAASTSFPLPVAEPATLPGRDGGPTSSVLFAPSTVAEPATLPRRCRNGSIYRAAKSFLIAAGLGLMTPNSVMMPVTNRAGVTSNAGFRALAPGGATRTRVALPRLSRPAAYSTSS